MSNNEEVKKLKTLKDLPVFMLHQGGSKTFSEVDLRDVAREWIKHFNNTPIKGYKSNSECFLEDHYDIDDIQEEIIDWIRHFFNLEEDE